MTTKLDLVIIGAGPCGLACGVEAQRRGLEYIILEKGSLTESIRNYPMQMTFFSTAENIEIAQIPFSIAEQKPNRSQALQYYRGVAEHFQLKIKLYSKVESIERRESLFYVEINGGSTYISTNVVIATGYFDMPNPLSVKGENLPHVSHYYSEPYQYVHQKVCIVGGGNSAIGTALELSRHKVEVTMLIKGDSLKKSVKYWLLPDIENRIKEGKIKVYYDSEVVEISDKEVFFTMKNSPRLHVLESDFVLLLTGYQPDVNFLKKAGVEFQNQNLEPVYDKSTLETNVQGLYLAGTVVCGLQTEKIFIENGRFHAEAILNHIIDRKLTSTLEYIEEN